jgi:hypothetical protein
VGKPANVIPPVEKKLSLPSNLVADVELQLFSELEGRVPHGAWSRLITGLLQQWLDTIPKELRNDNP